MSSFPVTDAHIHVQPWWEIKPAVLEVMMRGRSDVDELQQIMKSPAQLLRRLDADGIERAVLVNYPSPDLMGFTHSVNEYVAQYCAAAPDRLVPMGGVHPRFAEDAGAEVRRAAGMGVKALKVHPPHMQVEPNAYLHGLDALRAIYEEAQRLRLPVMIHTGTSIFPGARSRAGEPIAVDDVAVDFPDLTIVIAHGGRPLWMEQAFFLVRRFPRVFMDVSSIPPSAILRYFPRLAEVADKVLYGSDWPAPGVRSMGDNLRAFQALDLSPEAQRQMLCDNARRVFA
ncbi:MAG TPA: amidohydrolase family protein [Vicinamibacteria bacterium]|nr:amidohydrolase family protein [Vicinamibacteria bacterium]